MTVDASLTPAPGAPRPPAPSRHPPVDLPHGRGAPYDRPTQLAHARTVLAGLPPGTSPVKAAQALYRNWYLGGGGPAGPALEGPHPRRETLAHVVARHVATTTDRPDIVHPQPHGFVALGAGTPDGSPRMRVYLRPALLDVETTLRRLLDCLVDQPWFFLKVRVGDGARTASDLVVAYLQTDVAGSWRLADSLALPFLDPPPALALSPVSGVGLAPDPDDGRSFGEAVCAEIAEAVMPAGDLDASALLDDLVARGVVLPDERALGRREPRTAPSRDATTSDPTPPAPGPSDRVDAALALLEDLMHSAVDGGAGGWMQVRHGDLDVVEPAGPELWGGSAGIALVLADAAMTADLTRWAAMAVRATHHALAAAAALPSEWRFGLLGGTAGIAAAALAVAVDLDDQPLRARALAELDALIRDAADHPPAEVGDVVTGLAGLALWAGLRCGTTGTVGSLADRVLEVARHIPATPATTSEAGYAHGHDGLRHLRHVLSAGAEATRLDTSPTDPVGPTLTDLPMSWCRGTLGGFLVDTLTGVPAAVPDDVTASVHDALTGRRMPASLCHGPLGAAAVLDLHRPIGTSDHLGSLLAGPAGVERLVRSYGAPAEDRAGLFSGRAGAAHALLCSARRAAGDDPLRMPFGVLEP